MKCRANVCFLFCKGEKQILLIKKLDYKLIIRNYISCETCDQKYITRVGIGLERNCKHTFDCKKCTLPITVNAVSVPPKGYLQCIENCRLRDEEEDGVIINLHSSFAFDEDKFHFDKYFASLEYIKYIFPYIEMRDGKLQDVSQQFEVPNCEDVWSVVKNLLNLEQQSSMEKAIGKQLNQFRSMRSKYKNVKSDRIDEVLKSFFHDMFYPKIDWMIEPVVKLISNLKMTQPILFEEFKEYYEKNLKRAHTQRYSAIFSDYFRNYEQFRQVLIHSRVPGIDFSKKIVGSKRFDEVKLYYGQAYETLTSSYVIFACVNNIKNGRNFNKFLSMDLDFYINNVNKARKSENFATTNEFVPFLEFDKSALRNGSHHASIWREGERVFYRSGGTGAERDIPYVEYLHYCNSTTIGLAALFLIERTI